MRNFKLTAHFLLICAVSLFVCFGCTRVGNKVDDLIDIITGEDEVLSAQELAWSGMDEYDDKEYKKALEHFQNLKDNYPFSKYAILAELKTGEDLYPGVLGIGFEKEALYTADPLIASIADGSPADAAGFEEGDQVVEIAGRPIYRPAEVCEEIGRRYAGQTIHVAVLRDGELIERDVELVDKVPDAASSDGGLD